MKPSATPSSKSSEKGSVASVELVDAVVDVTAPVLPDVTAPVVPDVVLPPVVEAEVSPVVTAVVPSVDVVVLLPSSLLLVPPVLLVEPLLPLAVEADPPLSVAVEESSVASELNSVDCGLSLVGAAQATKPLSAAHRAKMCPGKLR